ITGTVSSPLTMASARHGNSAGQRSPSTSASSGTVCSASTARFIASMLAHRMLSVSISSPSACATAQASAFSLISISSASRRCSVSSLESARPSMGRAGSSITAAAVTVPASGPRPASSTPAIRIISPIIASPLKPHRLAVYCGRDQRENAGARHGVALTFATHAVRLGAMSRRRLLISGGLLLASGIAAAEEVRNLQVTHERGHFHVSFDAVLEAPGDKARPFMIEPRNWPRLSDIVTDAKVIETIDERTQKVRIGFCVCVLLFCLFVFLFVVLCWFVVGDIVTHALPGQGDFGYVCERWRISGDDRRTRVEYEAELVPSFFVPPLIGPYLLKGKLQHLLTETARNLEQLAR